MNTNKTQILAMFTTDTSKNDKDKFTHLIASVVKYDKIINYEELYTTLEHIEGISKVQNKWQIIRISINDDVEIQKSHTEKNTKYFNLIDLEINLFLNEDISLIFPNRIFDYYINNKKMNTRTVFIFEDISWENIVLLFKLNNFNISGGSTSKRHLISTVQVNLIEFLIALENFNINLSRIYKSFKEPFFIKKSIDLEKYNNYNLEGSNIYRDNELILNYLENNKKINFIFNQWLEKINLSKTLTQNKEEILAIDTKISINEDIINNGELLLKNPDEIRLKKRNKKLKNKPKADLQLKKRLEAREKNTAELKVKNKINKSNYKSLIKRHEDVIKKYNSSGSDVISKFEKRIDRGMLFLKTFHSNNPKVRKFSSNSVTNTESIKESNVEPISSQLDIKKSNQNTSLFSFLDFIEEIIQNSKNDPVSAQEKIEFEWIKITKNIIETPSNQINKNLSFIIKQANETLEIKKENKSLKKKFPKLYKKLSINELLISISIIITRYAWSGFTSIAMKIAYEIILNLYVEKTRKTKNKNILIKDFEISLGITTEADKLRLGSFFIELFSSEPTCLFERNYKNENNDSEISDQDLAILVVNEEYLDLISKDPIVNPASLPMLCKPNVWDENNFGGFLINKIEKKDIISKSKFEGHEVKNRAKLYNAINYLNSIKFKINTPLLNYLENEGSFLLDHYFKELNNKSSKNQAEITLKIAKSYSNIKIPIYINTFADWRSRLYSYSYFINYQGNDLSSSLLNFYEGSPLTLVGKYFLYIFGANCHNTNKISKENFSLRVNWVKENYDKIINLDPELILKAESKFLFTSFCLTMKELHTNPKTKVYLPIYLDATCSGIQHLAALLRDSETGSKVNLIQQKFSDSVGDIYSFLIDPVNEAINKYGRENYGFEIFKTIKLDRSHIKLPIMTKVYNVSVIGIADQLRSNFKKIKKDKKDFYIVPTKENDVVHLSFADVFKIAQILDEQIFISLPSLKSIYTYFKEVIKLLTSLNLPIVWFTPTGLEIRQNYLRSKQNKVSIAFTKKSKTIILKEVLNKTDKIKQVQAIIPNIIHSLDASHLINLMNTAIDKNFTPIISIHDCFGTHPNRFKNLFFLVKSEFILLYTKNNFLNDYHNKVLETFKDNQIKIFKEKDGREFVMPYKDKFYIPIKPKSGDLDLEKIIKSKHFIT